MEALKILKEILKISNSNLEEIGKLYRIVDFYKIKLPDFVTSGYSFGGLGIIEFLKDNIMLYFLKKIFIYQDVVLINFKKYQKNRDMFDMDYVFERSQEDIENKVKEVFTNI